MTLNKEDKYDWVGRKFTRLSGKRETHKRNKRKRSIRTTTVGDKVDLIRE